MNLHAPTKGVLHMIKKLRQKYNFLWFAFHLQILWCYQKLEVQSLSQKEMSAARGSSWIGSAKN